MSRHLFYSIVSRCVGVLLLAAAGLKLNGLAVDPVGGTGVLGSTAIQVAVVEFEVLLAAWLLWGGFAVGCWAVSVSAFTVFAAVSGWQGWIGRASCGCFGQVTVNPWWAFSLDVAVLMALLLVRPRFRRAERPVIRTKAILPVACGFLVVVVASGAVAGFAAARYGSLDDALAALRGERISLYPRTVDVGTGETGEGREVSVRVVNRTPQPIRLIGGTRD